MSSSIKCGKIENFTASRNTGWVPVTFPTAFDDGDEVCVFAQIQTHAGPDTPGVRLQNVTYLGFEVIMDEIVASNTTSSSQGNLGKVESRGLHPHAETPTIPL